MRTAFDGWPSEMSCVEPRYRARNKTPSIRTAKNRCNENRFTTCMVLQAACHLNGAARHMQIRHSPNPTLTDFGKQPRIAPSLPCNGLHPHNPRIYMDFYSSANPQKNGRLSGRMEGWVGLGGWLIADNLPTKWSPVNHRLAQGRESQPAKDRRPNHWAAPPTRSRNPVTETICCWTNINTINPVEGSHCDVRYTRCDIQYSKWQQWPVLSYKAKYVPMLTDIRCCIYTHTTLSLLHTQAAL